MTKGLHPMVHENRSTLRKLRFVSYFDGNEFFFKDHKIKNKSMLPGVAYLEMARIATELASEGKATAIMDVVWMRPIVFEDDTMKIIEISLVPQEDAVAYEVRSLEEVGVSEACAEELAEKIIYAQGRVVFKDEGSGRPEG